MKKVKNITIIGSGFSALAASAYLAKSGHQVTVYEKNSAVGGRARRLVREGFTFDMGPSWYWMPDVFERFFADFGKKTTDYYELVKLSPAYRVYYGIDDFIAIADNLPEIIAAFEAIEKGSGAKLQAFMDHAKSNYDIAIAKFCKISIRANGTNGHPYISTSGYYVIMLLEYLKKDKDHERFELL